MKTVQQIRSRITHLENRNKDWVDTSRTLNVLYSATSLLSAEEPKQEIEKYVIAAIKGGQYGVAKDYIWVLE